MLEFWNVINVNIIVISTISEVFSISLMQNLKMLAEDEREVSISRELHHLTIFTKLECFILFFRIIANDQQKN